MQTIHPLGHSLRPFLVYLTDNINAVGDLASDTSKTLWDGLSDEVREQGCDLLAVVCGGVRASFSSRIHDLIVPQSANGFVSWISVGGGRTDQFFSRFENSPLISLSQQHGQHPVVAVDNGPGIKNLLLHLVQVHGRQRIAFVRGPGNHPYAVERFQAYCDALHDVGLPYDEALVSPLGPWDWQTGAEAIRVFLDERGLVLGRDLDAIMCASDRIAMGALQELTERGIRVPDDVAMTGFNNLLEARSSRPSLSTVAMPFARKSRVAVQWLLAELRDEKTAPAVLDPVVVLGESCGCSNRRVESQQALSFNLATPVQTPAQSCQADLLRIYPSFRYAPADCRPDVVAVLAAFTEALHEQSPQRFADWLLARVESGNFAFMDMLIWQDVLAVLRQHLAAYCADLPALTAAELTIHKARLAIDDYFARTQTHARLLEMRLDGELRRINAELAYCSDVAGIIEVLSLNLPSLDVPSAWVALFASSDGVDVYTAPLMARLLFAFEHGQAQSVPAEGVLFPARELVPSAYSKPGERRSLILHPLADGQDEFGFVIFEMGPAEGTVYEALAYSIGTALKAALLRKDLRLRTEALEQSLATLTNTQTQLVEVEKMAALGELVAGVAHEINTPLGVGVTVVSSMADAAKRMHEALLARSASGIRNEIDTIVDGAELAYRNLSRAASLIESFKQIAVDQSNLHVRSISLTAYLDDIARSLSSRLKQGRHQLEIECDSALDITCDPGAIAQIFTNLIQNSVLHGFDGQQNGLIRIECRRVVDQIEINYSDNGRGMTDDVVEKIFLPFFTTRRGHGGSGLGMHIVYNLVTQGLGGTIHCESKIGQGTRFLIRFPVQGAAKMVDAGT